MLQQSCGVVCDLQVFRPLVDGLLDVDPYFLLADFAEYVETQCAADRAIREYCRGIRQVEPVEIADG